MSNCGLTEKIKGGAKKIKKSTKKTSILNKIKDIFGFKKVKKPVKKTGVKKLVAKKSVAKKSVKKTGVKKLVAKKSVKKTSVKKTVKGAGNNYKYHYIDWNINFSYDELKNNIENKLKQLSTKNKLGEIELLNFKLIGKIILLEEVKLDPRNTYNGTKIYSRNLILIEEEEGEESKETNNFYGRLIGTLYLKISSNFKRINTKLVNSKVINSKVINSNQVILNYDI